jgi:hypothetical protein
MDVASSSSSRPEDVLREMAAGSEEIGARLLRLAAAAAAVHRASILDLLSDDTPAPMKDDVSAVAGAPDAMADAGPETDHLVERDECSPRAGVHFAGAVRRTEAAR